MRTLVTIAAAVICILTILLGMSMCVGIILTDPGLPKTVVHPYKNPFDPATTVYVAVTDPGVLGYAWVEIRLHESEEQDSKPFWSEEFMCDHWADAVQWVAKGELHFLPHGKDSEQNEIEVLHIPAE